MGSQICLSFLFIMLSWGWTILKKKLSEDELDIALPAGGFVLLLHVILGCLTMIDSEESHKFNDYQGV